PESFLALRLGRSGGKIMNTFFDDVGDFHRKFNIPAFDPGRPCEFPSNEILEYRVKFLKEELKEFETALDSRRLADAIDALVDLAYVAFVTAHYFNAPINVVWPEVQRANLERILVTPETCP